MKTIHFSLRGNLKHHGGIDETWAPIKGALCKNGFRSRARGFTSLAMIGDGRTKIYSTTYQSAGTLFMHFTMSSTGRWALLRVLFLYVLLCVSRYVPHSWSMGSVVLAVAGELREATLFSMSTRWVRLDTQCIDFIYYIKSMLNVTSTLADIAMITSLV